MCPNCPHCAESSTPCQNALGSVGEMMGGLAGRADAMFGAVECQKTTGSLHYHFFLFVQRIHQYASLKEIAEKLERKLITAQELKDFLSNICCESYPDVEQFNRERQMLEEHFPTYSEHNEAQESNKWGDWKLGRIPAFLYKDTWSLQNRCSATLRSAQTASATSRSAPAMSIMADVEDSIDGARYKSLFQKAFQYFQSRCQHHIHKLVNGKRIVPNACRSKCKPKQCKHEAPRTNRVAPGWMTKPLLICMD